MVRASRTQLAAHVSPPPSTITGTAIAAQNLRRPDLARSGNGALGTADGADIEGPLGEELNVVVMTLTFLRSRSAASPCHHVGGGACAAIPEPARPRQA